ncbi:MAG: HD domain-containing protein [Pseudomonadota bacterium]
MYSYLKALINAGAEVFEVGGTVRDRLLERPTKDKDYLIRKLDVKQICQILEPFGKVALVGQFFGVIKFTPFQKRELTVDFSLPRKEYSTGLGHRDFDVKFDPMLPVIEDLGRRDFTINAMAYNIQTEELLDPFFGQKDLKNKLLRQVFDKAFIEDPLRMLRGIQFAARFNLKIEDQTLLAMQEQASKITTVSAERIAEEIKKLFLAQHPSVGFELMAKTKLLSQIFPELAALRGISQDKQPGEDVYDHTMRVLDAASSDLAIDNRGNINLLFAALLHDIGKASTSRYHEPSERIVFFGHQAASARMARKILKRLKVENIGVDIETVLTLIKNHMFETKAFYSDKAIRRFIHKIGKDLILLLIDLRLADNRGGKHPNSIKGVQKLRKRIIEEIERKPPFGPKDLAINGKDIMQLGVAQGPFIGQIQKQLIEVVLDDPGLNTKEHLLALVANLRDNSAHGATDSTHNKGKVSQTKKKVDKTSSHKSKKIKKNLSAQQGKSKQQKEN